MAAPGEETLHGAEAIAGALAIVERLAGRGARRVTGWATVELERAERELVAGSPVGSVSGHDVPGDELLGARCRLVTLGPADRELLLLEPATEGRIAGSLARFGEGPVVVYMILAEGLFGELVRAAAPNGLVLSAEAAGPFGRQRLVIGGTPWGAHLCIAQQAGAATIEP